MLFRKMIIDMKLNKAQFISIFIMAFLGVFIYSGVSGEWMGLRKAVDNYYEETNMADIWIYGNSFSEDDENSVKNIDGVKSVQRRTTVDTIGNFSNDPTIKLHIVEEDTISKPYLI